jgi:hypothetical protein
MAATSSPGIRTLLGAGGFDALVLKLDASGGVTWQKTYGGVGDDFAYSIQLTRDGGYVVAGYTSSFGEGVGDVWVLKLEAMGNVIWQKTYGGSRDDQAYTVYPTPDGGYVVGGTTLSFGVQSIVGGIGDAWVLKLDAVGNVMWQKTYATLAHEFAYSVQPAADGYIVAGSTALLPWVLKLDAAGDVTWQKTYGDTGGYAYSAYPTLGGGYTVAGFNQNGALVLKLDDTGGITWQHQYGAVFGSAYSVRLTADGGYVVWGIYQLWCARFTCLGS